MTFPFQFLTAEGREIGLVLAVLIGFAFGFVLERAGFGRANKLVAQFYGDDMTVLKVMFGAIVTAMLGTVILDGVGLLSLRSLADHATSTTYLWPMLIGGLLLGVGFVTAGYCPGTSAVAMASGKLDGLATVLGVVVGSVAMAELQPTLGSWYTSGELGHLYLYDLLGLPPAVTALAVTGLAVAMFLGGEWIERRVRGVLAPVTPRRPRLVTWASMSAGAIVGVATLLVPARGVATAHRTVAITPLALARRVVEQPWTLRVIDVRDRAACVAARVPGAECVPRGELGLLRLAESTSRRDLVLVAGGDVPAIPRAVAGYPGRVYALRGGFAAWKSFALTPPVPLPPNAGATERERFRLQTGLHAALTGARPAAPPPRVTGATPTRRRNAGGGGCS